MQHQHDQRPIAADPRWPAAGPGYGYAPGPPPPQASTNAFAIASFVLGILWLYWIGSILALVFGYVALRQIRQANGWQQGRGFALAGIVLGWVGAAILAFLLILVLAVADDVDNDFDELDTNRTDQFGG
jgi:hypothetical protein